MKKFLSFTALILISTAVLQIIPSNFSFAYTEDNIISEKYIPQQDIYNNSSLKTSVSNIYNVKSISNYTNYSIPSTINTKDEWTRAINYCMDTLTKSVTFKINNFNENVYNLKDLNLINASVQSKGTLRGTTATITYNFSYKENYILNKAAKDPKYISNLTNEQLTLFNKIKNITSSIIKPEMTEFEKEKAIHDYIVLHSSYSTHINNNSYNVRNLITKGTGVCEAYAYTFQLMCSFAGIECEIISGTLKNESHGWNLVKLDGEYYHVDVTSDDPVPDRKGSVLYTYFNVNDDEIAKTHKWNRNNFPKCTATKYNYYVHYNFIVNNPQQMEDFILKRLEQGAEDIQFYVRNFKIKGTEDFLFCNKSKRKLKSFNIVGNIGSSGAFSFRPNYAN